MGMGNVEDVEEMWIGCQQQEMTLSLSVLRLLGNKQLHLSFPLSLSFSHPFSTCDLGSRLLLSRHCCICCCCHWIACGRRIFKSIAQAKVKLITQLEFSVQFQLELC